MMMMMMMMRRRRRMRMRMIHPDPLTHKYGEQSYQGGAQRHGQQRGA
jgi:hypothetical protein